MYSISVFLPSRPLEYPDWVESADSDVADITELENPDKPEAGLENRPGAWPLHLSSDQDQVDSGLALLLAVEQEVLPLTIAEAKSKEKVLLWEWCVCVMLSINIYINTVINLTYLIMSENSVYSQLLSVSSACNNIPSSSSILWKQDNMETFIMKGAFCHFLFYSSNKFW